VLVKATERRNDEGDAMRSKEEING